ncbi:uncharacterized protein LOC131686789 [Topomyia yanbarensis]|uniref:uncharacterized protein LOC131686789 n=1 Tax=Topomyia yanbarensis TaxID=2498891 RepID=UPI00273BFC11|nr:uncharacterized protein LOC131686789 [Topomyia yanbarensis]
MEKVSPFFIKKAIDSITPRVTISRMKDGKLLLKSVDTQQAEKLMKQTNLGGQIGIRIEEHSSLNTTKGVVSCYDLKFLSDNEILEGLKAEHVTEIRRINRRNQNKELEPTSTVVLTFNLGYLPTSINVGFHPCRVRQYIPSPLRCMNCLKFGHTNNQCRGNRVCAGCANLYHDNTRCVQTICVNCRGSHDAFSKTCPVYEDEYEIQKIRVTDKISLREAKRKRRSQAPNPNTPQLTRSFATVTATGKVQENSIETNREIRSTMSSSNRDPITQNDQPKSDQQSLHEIAASPSLPREPGIEIRPPQSTQTPTISSINHDDHNHCFAVERVSTDRARSRSRSPLFTTSQSTNIDGKVQEKTQSKINF